MSGYRFFVRLVLTFLLCGVGLCSRIEAQQTSSTNTGGDAATDDQSKLENETFALINQYRKDNQLPPLKWSNDITQVARAHSKDMATGEVDFGHEGFSKRVALLKTKMAGLNGAGENVLKTDNPDRVAENAVQIWLHSPHHLANIRGDFNYSGMGIYTDDHGMIYFTQFFVKIVPPAPVQATAAPTQPTQVNPFLYLADPKTR